ncbi:exosortase A [Thermodesulfobacteriota bacterium]
MKLFILIILWAIAFYPVYPILVDTWLSHSNHSHGLLVPFISAYFIWQKRESLKKIKVSTSNLGLVILVLSMVFYIISFTGGIALAQRLMIVTSLAGLILFTMGRDVFRQLAFPILFLFFMVPVPDTIVGMVSFPLQLLATKISAFLIGVLSIPVYREGNMLYFAQAQLEVAEACSGIRSITSLTMLSFIFVYISDTGWIKKFILVASAIPIAFIANIMRVTGTGVLAHFYGEQVARGFIHEFSGLAVFAFGFILLLIEYRLLSKSK